MKILFACISLIFLSATNFAQSLSNYSDARTTGITYSSISETGSSISTWRNTGQFSQDDNRSFPNNIGFDFWYNGIRYTQFSVSSNGYLDFSSSTANGTGTGAYGYSNTRFSNTSPTGLALAPIYDDMTAQGGDDALGNSIKYLTSGTAPNRVLTVEWINMAVYNNTTPNMNFQVKLYETSGLIEFVYGTMTPGTASYSYSLGINSGTISNPPSSAQLLSQQSANSTNFSSSASNSLSTLPTSNSKISFTPLNHSGSFNGTISFTSVSSSAMTVNYSNWCTNEVGYAIYSSTDNVNFDFVTQNAPNTTNYVASGLSPSTTYYWRVYAVTEGKLSSAATGNRTTSGAGTKTSNTSNGNWNTNGSWTPSGVPSATDNVIIKNGHTITINANAQCNNLTIGEGSSGTVRIGSNGTSRNLNVNGNIVINNGATLIAGNSNATHTATISGNITNNGTLNFRPTSSRVVNVTFDKNGSQQITGTGGTTAFNNIIQNMGTSISNILDIKSTNFTAPDNFLTLTNGTFKLSSTNVLDIDLYSSSTTFTTSMGLHLNNSNATFRFNGGLVLYGNLTVQAGNVHIGDQDNENIESKGGAVLVSGGNLFIASRYYSTDINTLSDFSISSGSLVVPAVASSNTSVYPFHIQATGSTFNMSGGTIIIPREGGNGSQDLGMYLEGLAFNNIAAGTIQFGNESTPSNQNFKLFSTSALPDLTIHNSNTQLTLLSSIEVLGDFTNNTGSLNVNGNNMLVGGNWINSGEFLEGTSTITFNGTGTQNITSTGAEIFHNLTLDKISGSLNVGTDSVKIRGTLDLQNGTLNTNNKLILLSDASSTARVAAITNGTITGNVIAQRFMPGGSNKRKWRYMSSPVNVGGSISLTQFIDDIYVTGVGGATNGFDESPLNNPSIRFYDETISGVVDNGWVGAPTINTTYTTGTGFEIFGRGGRATQNPFDVNTIPLDATIDLIGTINKGNITKNLSYTNNGETAADGFNLVGNPYPSQIDFNAVGLTKTNIQNRFWVYNPNSGSYGVFDGELNEGTNGISRYISSGQSFFVKATSSGASLSFVENVKASNTPFVYFRSMKKSIASNNILRMTVQRDSLTSDELLMVFRPEASKTDSDPSDAAKFFNDQLNFYSKSSNGKNLAINVYPTPETSDTIKLSLFAYNGTSAPWEGTYNVSFSMDSIENFKLILVDYFKGEFISIDNDLIYPFEITSNPLSMGNNRFELISTKSFSSLNNQFNQKEAVSIFPNPVKDKLTIRLNKFLKDEICKVKLYNLTGELVFTDVYNIQNLEVKLNVDQLDPGVYIVQIDKDSGEWTGKFTKE